MNRNKLYLSSERHVTKAKSALAALESDENRIIGAAIAEAYASGWSISRRMELVDRLNEQVRDIHGNERMRHLQTIHDDGCSDAEAALSDREFTNNEP